ncbi:tetratricopeptide repeat protein [Dysgonomonas sp. ZJ279]|uniref:tetratricopeptide repeat protein n=1 Tax=Dysgonomonas sp. ZJ279 TaxID=2709796 RepID=UPI0013EDAD84|nr:tetratricopeptide repeat protein [Dysgonomonas sp. ZJ279]
MLTSNSRRYIKKIIPVLCLSFIMIAGNSCKLFDKDLEQDKHIAAFRHQMLVTLDSLKNPNDRILNFEGIIEQINMDEALITPRKKTILLKECYSFISNEYCNIENYDKAIEYCNINIELDSTEASGYFNRGVAYQGIGNDSLALIDYNKAININGNYTDAYYNCGIIYEDLQKYDLAIDNYTKAIKLNPSYIVDVYINRGNAYVELSNDQSAIADYNQAIQIDSMDVVAYCNRGNTYTNIGEYKNAINDYTKAINIDSCFAGAYTKRAFAYELLREYDNAVEDYMKALSLDPDNSQGINEMAKAGIGRTKTTRKVIKEIHSKKQKQG